MIKPTLFKIESPCPSHKLKEGDMICEYCNGWGTIYDSILNSVIQCEQCKGDGVLDWIENVRGKEKKVGNSVGTKELWRLLDEEKIQS